MPQIYLNGGGGFDGIALTDRFTTIDLIRDTLLAAGWTTVFQSVNAGPGAAYYVDMQGNAANGDTCFVRVEALAGDANSYKNRIYVPISNTNIVGNPGASLRADYDDIEIHLYDYVIQLRAAHTAAFTTTSRNYVVLVEESISRLWLTADQDSFGLIVGNELHRACEGIWCGFLDRVDDADEFAWGIGLMDIRLRGHQLAKAAHDGVDWKSPGHSFATLSATNAENTANTNLLENFSPVRLTSSTIDYSFQGAYGGLMDRFTSTMAMSGNLGALSDSPTDLNQLGYGAPYGSRNAYDGKVIVGRPWLVEGRADTLDYATATASSPLLYFRGYIKHMVTGLISCDHGTVVQDCDDINNYYMSAGARCRLGMQVAGTEF